MKNKLKLILGLLLLLQVQLIAQSNSNNGLFSSRNQQNENSLNRDHPGGTTPGGGGGEPTPIGSGLLALTGLSLGYAWSKHSRNED